MKRWGTLLLLGLLLGGCWDNRPIQTRAMVLGIGVDPGSRPGEMMFTFAVPSPVALTGLPTQAGQTQGVVPITEEAPSLIQAVAKAADHVSRDIYLGQLQYMVISTRLKPDQVEGLAETLARIPEVDLTSYVLASDGCTCKIVTLQGHQEVLPNVFIPSHLASGTSQETLLGVRAWEWLKTFLIPGQDAFLPVAKMMKMKDETHLDISRLAIYRRGLFLGEFNHDETLGWAYVMGRVRKAAYGLSTPKGLVVIRGVTGSGAPEVTLRGRSPELAVEVSVTGTINQAPLELHQPGQAPMATWAREGAGQIRGQVAAAIDKAQRLGADPFGFGKALWYRDGQAFPRNWDRVFRGLPVRLRIHLRITGEGVTV